jgi:hypothetical protein
MTEEASVFSLHIPEYEAAMLRFFGDVFQGFLDVDPVLKGFGRETTSHRGPIRNVRGDEPLDQQMAPIITENVLSYDVVRQGKIEDYIEMITKLTMDQRMQLGRQLFRGLGEITDATGMSIDAKGQPFSIDLFLDLLEKIEFDFDEDGNPIYPTLIVPPKFIKQLEKLTSTTDQETRRQQIIEKQRARFNASKRTRRLSR